MAQPQLAHEIKNALERAIPSFFVLSQGQAKALQEIAAHIATSQGEPRSFSLVGLSGAGKSALLTAIAPALNRFGIEALPDLEPQWIRRRSDRVVALTEPQKVLATDTALSMHFSAGVLRIIVPPFRFDEVKARLAELQFPFQVGDEQLSDAAAHSFGSMRLAQALLYAGQTANSFEQMHYAQYCFALNHFQGKNSAHTYLDFDQFLTLFADTALQAEIIDSETARLHKNPKGYKFVMDEATLRKELGELVLAAIDFREVGTEARYETMLKRVHTIVRSERAFVRPRAALVIPNGTIEQLNVILTMREIYFPSAGKFLLTMGQGQEVALVEPGHNIDAAERIPAHDLRWNKYDGEIWPSAPNSIAKTPICFLSYPHTVPEIPFSFYARIEAYLQSSGVEYYVMNAFHELKYNPATNQMEPFDRTIFART